MQKDSENKSKVINHFSQIINTTKIEYQIAVNKIKKLKIKISSYKKSRKI